MRRASARQEEKGLDEMRAERMAAMRKERLQRAQGRVRLGRSRGERNAAIQEANRDGSRNVVRDKAFKAKVVLVEAVASLRPCAS